MSDSAFQSDAGGAGEHIVRRNGSAAVAARLARRARAGGAGDGAQKPVILGEPPATAENASAGVARSDARAARALATAAMLRKAGRLASRLVDALSPRIASLLLFFGGVMVLVSAATPELADRIEMVSDLAPLAAIDLSHFAGSILATLMLFIAYGVARRLDEARRFAMGLCYAGAPLALLRGFLWEEALYLVLLGTLLAASRPAYYRRARISEIRPGGWWMAGIGLVVIVSAWIGFAAYEHVPYSDELWWTFVVNGDASRFLRAATGVGAVAALLVVWRYFGPLHPGHASPEEERRAVAIMSSGAIVPPEGWLAATGDKSFIFSATGQSMVMYVPHGDAWIAMGPPIGPACERRDAIWRFREQADKHNSWPAFYGISADMLPAMLDAGMVAQKVGETAIVDLKTWSMDGSNRARQRQGRARAKRDGFEFAVERLVPGSEFSRDLKAISDDWLDRHSGAEKSFSLGRFDETYLSHFPIGVLRLAGKPVAFANLWPGGPGGTVTVDLMRGRGDVPKGCMENLLVECLLWAKTEGFSRFDLGMAPLAGLESRKWASFLTRVGAFIYRHGGRIYGFSGLRAFKDKFDPQWEPRYLAAPGAWRLSAALWRTALLTSGGIRGMLKG